MDQPTLGCKFPTIINASESEIPSASRPPLLRRVSQSDPHLDIPHFLSVQDKGLGFHPTLTGLLENTVNFKIGHSSEKLELMDSVPSLPQDLKVPKSSLDRNKSAFELCSSSQADEAPLRKSSSVANYQIDPCIRREGGGLLSSFSSALHLSSGQSHQQQITKPSEEQGGLTMSVKSSPFSGNSSSSTASPSTSETTPTPDPALNRNKSGLMGVFNRGFFAKPVMCNQEENYRYIMALDR